MPPTIPVGTAPAAAANISEAIDRAVAYVHYAHLASAVNLRTQIDAWNVGIRDEFADGADATRRAITNWNILTFKRAAAVLSALSRARDADDLGNLVWRTLHAVRAAYGTGVISLAQLNAAVTLFNTVWT